MNVSAEYLRRLPEPRISANIRASHCYQREHVLPDPIGLRDLLNADPAKVAAAIVRRAEEGRLPCRRSTLRWPKGFDRSAYRMMSSMDTLDQLAYRMIAEPCAELAEKRLAASVVAHRFETADGTWRSKGVRSGWMNRKQVLVELFERSPTLWLAVSDVKNYYPSLTPATISLNLQSMGADAWLVDLATGFLQEFEHLPGTVGGVPVGFEASSVFGTIGLMSIDRVFAHTMHFRLVDDLWSVADSEAEGHDHGRKFADALTLHGMAHNKEKSKVLNGADALGELSDPDIDYLVVDGGQASVADALRLIDSGISEHKIARLRFGLGALRRHQSRAAVHRFVDNVALLDIDPNATGSYLRVAAPGMSELEREVLVNHACGDSDDHALAGRIRVAHALAGTKLSASQGDRLMDSACTMNDRRLQPLRSHMIVAAGRGACAERRIDQAMQVAEGVDSLDLRRAVAHLHGRTSRRKQRSALTHLCRIDPEVRPFLEPVLARL